MSFRAKALMVFCLFGAGAALLWLRHPTLNVVTPVISSQGGLSSEDNVGKLVAKPAVTPANSDRIHTSVRDDFEFVAKSAKKALDGDGKAALQIGDVLGKCLPTKIQYRDKQDPQAAFESDLEGQKSPDWIKDRMRSKFLECHGFIHGNPFAGLPDRPGGYDSMRFWNDLAYQANNPVAMAQHAAGQAGIITGTADNSKIEIAQSDINKAAASGDPEALFRVGGLLADGRVGKDPLNGFAVMIAACNLGYDCTTDNEFAFGACAAANMCPQGEIYTDKIRETIGDADFARAYSRAQQFQDALARGDASAVQQFVQLKRATSTTSR
jgi:hypothetical protein